MPFRALIDKQHLHDGFIKSFLIDNHSILVIQLQHTVYLIENKCGHFGVPLDTAKVQCEQGQAVIYCREHGISFDLMSGEVVNRPWENCDSLTVYQPVIEDNMLGFYSD